MTSSSLEHNKEPSQQLLLLELLSLFLIAPTMLITPIYIGIKLLMIVCALLWVGLIAKRAKLFSKETLLRFTPANLFSSILLRWLLFVIFSTLLMAWLAPGNLFDAVLQMPLLWLGISLFYALFSVYPQEFVYRVFFFHRYRTLISSPTLFIIFNAVIFCYAHLVFLNTLVMLLTFAGGLLFAYSYQKYQSLMLTSIEHALYGVWLYTLGMGAMLAFPGP